MGLGGQVKAPLQPALGLVLFVSMRDICGCLEGVRVCVGVWVLGGK